MNLDHLRYFVALSRTENYTQTAKLLHITQPSLTKAIHSLEAELNIDLFQKAGRSVTSLVMSNPHSYYSTKV